MNPIPRFAPVNPEESRKLKPEAQRQPGDGLIVSSRRVLPFRRYLIPDPEKLAEGETGPAGQEPQGPKPLIPAPRKHRKSRIPAERREVATLGDALSISMPTGLLDWSTGSKTNVGEIKKPWRKPPRLARSGANAAVARVQAAMDAAADGLLPSFERVAAKRHRRFPKRLLAAAAVLFGVVFSVMVGGIHTSEARNVVAQPDQETKFQTNASYTALVRAEDQVARSKALLEKFFASPDPANETAIVWDDGHTAERMREYYSRPGVKPGGRFTNPMPRVAKLSGNTVHWWWVTTSDGTDRIAGVIWQKEMPKLYWEHMVGYGAMPWDRFIRELPSQSLEMRLVMCCYDGHDPSAEGTCRVILTHPDSRHEELGLITEPGMAKHFKDYFQAGGEGVLVTGEIGYGKDAAGKPQLEVRKIITLDWGQSGLAKTAAD